MSENEAVFFKLDMQPAIAALIFANDGRCGGDEGVWVSCDGEGEGSCFPGTPCPLEGMLFRGIIPCPCWGKEQRAVAAKDWLAKYHQRKAEAVKEHERAVEPESRRIGTKRITAMEDGMFLVGSELVRSGAIIRIESPGDTFTIEVCNEKPEAEAAKKQEQKAKPEPVKPCGNCRYAEDIGSNTRQVVMCERTGHRSPVGFTGCPDFEPRTSEKSVFERLSADIKSGTEAAEASSKIIAEYLSGVAFSTRLAGDKDETERVSQLEKENAELQSTNEHLREELAWQFEQLTKKIGMLQDQNDRLRGELDAATKEKDSANSSLAEQLKQMGQRIKDLEREAGERSWPPRPRFFL